MHQGQRLRLAEAGLGARCAGRKQSGSDQHPAAGAACGVCAPRRRLRRAQSARESARADVVGLGPDRHRYILQRRRASLRHRRSVPAAGGRLLRSRRAGALAGRRDPTEGRLCRGAAHRLDGGPLRRRPLHSRDDAVMPAATPGTSTAVDPLASRIPITVITGFLGSGKTTLLRRLLRHPGMSRAAVIINEFGDVAIDHELVAASSEQMTLLSNGCLCCSLRTDLQETLRELFVKRRAGEVIDFDRVFIETSGLADPVPVLHTLQTDGLLGAQYRLNGVVTLVDAVNGIGQLDAMPEAAKQAAVADRLVITKTDIAERDTVDRLQRRLQAMNRFAPITTAVDGELDPTLLADIGPQRVTARSEELGRWLNATTS